MPLDADIIDRIRSDFLDSDSAISALIASGKTGRVARCTVFASSGSLEKLREYIQMADVDFRDVIVAGEYDGAKRQVRDLCVSFLIATPDDFWIGEIAKLVHEREYFLTEVSSRNATVGPFDYTCDRSEGMATFSNGVHQFAIKKHDRRWSVICNESLCRFGLDEPLDDEERFRIQLDFYLSQNDTQTCPQTKSAMSMENTDSVRPMPIFDHNTRLAETNAVVWFLGFGAGGATGLALAYALYAIWLGAPIWIALVAAFVAATHATIIVAFWLNREVVLRRTALMVSMISSAVLTCSLAWMIGSNGMRTTPLYGLAFMHLIMAFCHPSNIRTEQLSSRND